MSELTDSALAAITPALDSAFAGLADDYFDGMKEALGDSYEAVRPLVTEHLKKAAGYKQKALAAENVEERRAYTEGVADELRSAKTVMVSEGVAITEDQAETFAAGFSNALNAVGAAAKGILTALVSGIASGAIKGLMGGSGPDLGPIFPGA